MGVLEYLSIDIGERPSGTCAEMDAANYLRDQFASLGLETEIQAFRFLGWRAKREPNLQIVSPVSEPMHAAWVSYTASTPGVVTGFLRPAGIEAVIPGLSDWPRYAVVDQYGEEQAYILGNTDGPAFPVFSNNLCFTAPQVVVSEDDKDRIQRWLDNGEEVMVELSTESEFLPDLAGHNVVATLPGMSDETIIVCAHFDTIPGAPGAEDNATGVQVVYDIAAVLAGTRPAKTIQFIAFGAEEDFLLGSRYFVKELRSRGGLERIKAVVNFDSVGIGNRLVCRIGPEEFQRQVASVLDSSGPEAGFEVSYTPPYPSSDHYPFIEEGISAAMIVVHPCYSYHFPGDTIETIEPDTLRRISGIGLRLVRALM